MDNSILDIYEKRIKQTNLSSVLTFFLIILISCLYLSFVISFDNLYNNKPKEIREADNFGRSVLNTLYSQEQRIEKIFSRNKVSERDLSSDLAIALTNMNESLDTIAIQAKSINRNVQENGSKIYKYHLDSKMILVGLTGLFVLFILKLLINLYQYINHLKSHYISIHDSLYFSANPGETNLETALQVTNLFSSKEITINPTKDTIKDLSESVANIRKTNQ